jgi:hypothetical protein
MSIESKDQNLLEELILFEENTRIERYSEKKIFSIIGRFDKKYEGDIEYEMNINGVLCNIGSELQYINVLNFAAGRLRKALTSCSSEKYTYDLGNTILCIAEIENPSPHTIESLLSSTKFNEARTYFDRVSKNDDHFPPAVTNSSNILAKYGRNLEAIYLYDDALRANPNFGMALANKAQAIEDYVRLSPNMSLRLIDVARALYQKALLDSSIDSIGGTRVRKLFIDKIQFLKSILEANSYHTPGAESQSLDLSEYLKFCIEKNLFLNYDFGYYYDEESVLDNLFPSFIDYIGETRNKRSGVMSDRVYFAFQVFNQILESYTTSRLQYFSAMTTDQAHLDNLISYIYTLDYTQHRHKYGTLKISLSTLYNCLDKIAHLMYYYFIEFDKKGTRNIYFNWLLSDEFRSIVVEQNNYQLLALRSLALDFEKEHRYHYLNGIRNRITHSFLNINTEIFYDSSYSDFEITESMLIEANDRMFLIVKSAVMYAVNALAKQQVNGQLATMNAILERDIFH